MNGNGRSISVCVCVFVCVDDFQVDGQRKERLHCPMELTHLLISFHSTPLVCPSLTYFTTHNNIHTYIHST